MTVLTHPTIHPRTEPASPATRPAGTLPALRRAVATTVLKARSGRGLFLTVLVGAVMTATSAGGAASSLTRGATAGDPASYDSVLRLGMTMLLFAAVSGALLVSGEYRHKTIARTVALQPRRGVLLAASSLVAAAIGLVTGVIGAIVATAIATLTAHANGVDYPLDAHRLRILLGLVLVNVLAGPWGVAWGTLVPNPVVVVSALVLWTSMLEGAIVHFLPQLGIWLPGGAQGGMYLDTTPGLLGQLPSAALFGGYLALALALAAGIARRRNIA